MPIKIHFRLLQVCILFTIRFYCMLRLQNEIPVKMSCSTWKKYHLSFDDSLWEITGLQPWSGRTNKLGLKNNCKWLDFQFFLDKDYKPLALSNNLSFHTVAVKESTHTLNEHPNQRGRVVPAEIFQNRWTTFGAAPFFSLQPIATETCCSICTTARLFPPFPMPIGRSILVFLDFLRVFCQCVSLPLSITLRWSESS